MKKAPSWLARGAASFFLLTSTPGCSFIFVNSPPSSRSSKGPVVANPALRCTSSKVAPALDTAFGALQLVRTALAASASDRVYEDPKVPISREADIALGVGFMTLFVSSAVYGFVTTGRCSRLKHGDGGDYDPRPLPEPTETWSAGTQEVRPAAPPPHPGPAEPGPNEAAESAPFANPPAEPELPSSTSPRDSPE